MSENINYTDKHPILKAIPSDRYITKKELIEITKLGDREVRKFISEAAQDVCIYFANQRNGNKGYRRGKPFQEMSNDELINDFREGTHSINNFKSREKKFNKRKRRLIGRNKAVEKELRNRGVEIVVINKDV